MSIRKAVIPTAGFGTRFLPVTRSVPKNMLPVLDRPSIHFAVEEAVTAGIEHVVFVLAHGQEAICRYFDRLPELEQALERRGEYDTLQQMIDISETVGGQLRLPGTPARTGPRRADRAGRRRRRAVRRLLP